MQFKIKTLLLSVMIFIVAVPMLIILVMYNTGIRTLFESRSESYSYEIIKQAGENISTLIEQAHFTEKRLISSVRTSQILLEYSNAVPMQKLGVISDIERMIWDYKQSANYISDIYLFGDDNRLFSTTTATDLAMLKNAPWITSLSEQGEQTRVTATHKAYYDIPDSRLTATQRDKHVVSFIRKVYLLGLENKYSIVQTDIKYSEIDKIMERVDLGSGGLAVIVDDDDNIIYCENKAYLGAPLLSYMKIYKDSNWGEDLARTEYSLGNIPWRVIGFVSTEMIAAEFGQINRVLMVAFFVSTITSGLLITIICRQITHPITLLGKRMHEVGNGNFSTIYPNSLCKEFYDLTEQFNHMVDQVDDLMYMVQRQEQEKAAAEFKALQN